MLTIFSLIANFLAALPGLENFGTAWISKIYDSKVAIVTAQIGGDVEKAKAIVAAQVGMENARVSWIGAVASSPVLTYLIVVFSLPLALYLWKDVVWDVIIGSFFGCAGRAGEADPARCAIFVTDAIKSTALLWGNAIIYSLFGAAGAVTLGAVLKPK